MIKLTQLNNEPIYINPHQIEFIKTVPDTLIEMFSERKMLVFESVDEVMEKIIIYRKTIGFIGNDTTN